jgi:hypothetical protein
MSITNLSLFTPESEIDPSMASEKEVETAITAHLAATDARYLRADVVPPTYGSLVIPGSKTGYAGFTFTGAFNATVFMLSANAWQHGVWSAGASHKWLWQYNNGWLRVFNSTPPTSGQTARGVYIGLEKGFGSLPGYPNDDFPAVRTDYPILFFSVGNVYSSHITSGGTYVAVSDKDKKKQAIEINYLNCLHQIKKIPIYEYSFMGESDVVRRYGPYAQDFYAAFKLGGIEDNSPMSPDKVLAPSDAIGVLWGAVKALAREVDILLKSESLKK